MIPKILIALAIVILVFVIVVASRPADFRYQRSIAISAPPSAVFPHVNDLHKWQAWSPWAKKDPAAKTTFEGPPAGMGAAMSWDGNNDVGAGKMTVVASEPSSRVQYQLDFKKPFEGTNLAEFTFVPQGSQTLVTWSMSGKNTFVFKAISLFMDCDKMIGGDFEKGLADLKTLVESGKGSQAMSTPENAIINTRLFATSREKLFGAFGDPELLAKWWGPEGFTNTFEKFEFRPGGEWKFVMHAPNGADFPNESEFLEIVAPEKIVFDHLRPMHHYHMVMSFEDEGGKTRLTWNMSFQDPAESAKLREFIFKANEQNFDRLEALLAAII